MAGSINFDQAKLQELLQDEEVQQQVATFVQAHPDMDLNNLDAEHLSKLAQNIPL